MMQSIIKEIDILCVMLWEDVSLIHKAWDVAREKQSYLVSLKEELIDEINSLRDVREAIETGKANINMGCKMHSMGCIASSHKDRSYLDTIEGILERN